MFNTVWREKKGKLISILKSTALSTIDLYWTEHLEHLQQLIEGIHLRQYTVSIRRSNSTI
ncbi:hypothetical protein [Gottfriedia acidiceleris]|uniref:hypothetical protein n=1 Tax=Gottfriedia acidiceleris TaxID=371036 RepID=UPI003D7FB9DF